MTTAQTATAEAMQPLGDILLAAGSRHTPESVTALLQGLLAAPADSGDDTRWQLLFPNETPEALAAIGALKAQLEHKKPAAEPPVGERLALLRAEMQKRGVDGFFVPRADEFQGEYVPASAERLAWITNFHGSAGCAIVLADKAAFFTDGRYTLQALSEVDGAHFTRYSTADNQPPLQTLTAMDYLAQNLQPGQVFGIDPWLHTPAEVTRLHDVMARVGATLKLLDNNPLDAAWATRPPAPLAPVVPHPLQYSGIASADKRRVLADILKQSGAEVLAVTLPEDICWLLNVRGGDVPCTPFALSYALAYADGRVDWFVDSRKLSAEIIEWLGPDVSLQPLSAFATAVETLAKQGRKFWIDPASAPARLDAVLRDLGQTPHLARTPLSLMKSCKNETEIAGSIAAHLRDGVAVTRFLAALSQQGGPAKHDELSAAALLYSLRRQNEHFRGASFETISGAAGNGAIVHYRSSPATNKQLLDGPVYLCDSGAQYLDGTTDITRTIAVDQVSDEMRDRYTRVLKGHIQVAISTFPAGTAGDVLDVKARAALREVGLDYAHGTGHGVGSYLSVHEGPCSLSPRGSGVPLMPGMILSNEPGYYKNGEYGIRIENLLLVVNTGKTDADGRALLGFQTLTLAPIDRNLIEPSLLTAEEREWLNAYHANVREKLMPELQKVDPASAEYLRQATQPI